MSKKSFKRVGELHDGITFCVEIYIQYAKSASRNARQARRQGHDDRYWKYRTERLDWIRAARLLLKKTTNGVVTDVVQARRQANWWAAHEAKKGVVA